MVTMACCTFFCSAERLLAGSSLLNLVERVLMMISLSAISSPFNSTNGSIPRFDLSLELWLMFWKKEKNHHETKKEN